jgi:hypothetical protein
MRRFAMLLLPILLAACGGGEENKVTETRMDDIDSLEGTISDEMPNADELNEQPMIDTTPVAGPKPKVKAEKPEKAEDTSLPEKAEIKPEGE